jgi:hypothetical protein
MTVVNHARVAELFPVASFDIASLEDEIRADQLIGDLLRQFFADQVEGLQQEPEVAGRLTRGADYFLREFLISDRRENIFHIRPERVRQFAGNWYIIRNLEPNMADLGDILEGVAAFYIWLDKARNVTTERATEINRHCQDFEYYQQRIESFWAIEGDGFSAWNMDCPLVQAND